MIPWALQFHAPGIHHATNPVGNMAHMPGLQGHHHPMPRSTVLLTCLVPHSHLATGWMWLGEGLSAKAS